MMVHILEITSCVWSEHTPWRDIIIYITTTVCEQGGVQCAHKRVCVCITCLHPPPPPPPPPPFLGGGGGGGGGGEGVCISLTSMHTPLEHGAPLEMVRFCVVSKGMHLPPPTSSQHTKHSSSPEQVHMVLLMEVHSGMHWTPLGDVSLVMHTPPNTSVSFVLYTKLKRGFTTCTEAQKGVGGGGGWGVGGTIPSYWSPHHKTCNL